MVRVDTLLLAKYGIFQPTRRCGPLAMTVLQPIETLTQEDREDLQDFARFVVAQHDLDDTPARGHRDPMVAACRMATSDDLDFDDEDEGVLRDEA